MSYLTPIYDVWDGNAEALAADIGELGVTVRQWRNRGNIPPIYWKRIIDAAGKKRRTLEWEQFVPPGDVRGRAILSAIHTFPSADTSPGATVPGAAQDRPASQVAPGILYSNQAHGNDA